MAPLCRGKNKQLRPSAPRSTWIGFENSRYCHFGTNRSTIILSNRDTLDTDELWEALVEKYVGE